MQETVEYRRTEVNTSDKVRIVILLYEGAINFIRVAKRRLAEGDIPGKGLFIGKATGIIAELSSSLNMEAGGEIAANLARLYDFLLDRLLQANMKNDQKALDDGLRVLEELIGAWQEIAKKDSPRPFRRSEDRGMELRI